MKKIPNALKLLLKLILTAIALFIVLEKIDVEKTKEIFAGLKFFWLLPAFFFFNLSKILGALRLNYFFRTIGLALDEMTNLRLYYIGMFYNLFLPGGIGGDAYKIIFLKKQSQSAIKKTTLAVLLDRFSGLLAIVFLLQLFLLATLRETFGQTLTWLLIASLFLPYPLYSFLVKQFLPDFFERLALTNGFALGVQLSQVICSIFLLLALDQTTQIAEYLTLFLFSSIVAVLPFTVGGLGARELGFVFGHQYLHADVSTAIAFSLLFFILTATSSLVGAFLRVELNNA
ncbi:conserved hypothetical protein [Chloroherpeton thalassium ATCC 35110]|uniref:Lysylphosphatidylglycerol synthetase/UPF0104 n=1 Tax=Chloroherpeton thalassium (strain ATCC 35110 / GB-78) TaxID=517418 RepID=B3QTR4_CHLT3|nr:lysylphosphatidylglycerol synthase transmembrane domain-containing protein [Chloroherpeton thalassium]ACF14262.1 conserved hypothetical protein [Chloroherpeton thalassium ATCC 35110]